MSDHSFDPVPPDLPLITDLIDDSSLGSPDALEAQNDVPPEVVMKLRDRVRQDVPDRCWDKVPESITVLRCTEETVFPDHHGEFTLPTSVPLDGTAFLVDRAEQEGHLLTADLLLPGGPQRRPWTVYVVDGSSRIAHRCEIEMTWADDGGIPRWRAQAAIWWQLVDAEKAAIAGRVRMTDTLLQHTALRLGYTGTSWPDTVGKQILFEHTLSQLLREQGIAAECAVRILRAGDTGAGRAAPTPQPPSPLPPGISEDVQALMRMGTRGPSTLAADLISMMWQLHERDEHLPFQDQANALVHQVLPQAQIWPSSTMDPYPGYNLARILALLHEALRVAGLQIDDADHIVASVLAQIPEEVVIAIVELLRMEPMEPSVLELFVSSAGIEQRRANFPIDPACSPPLQGRPVWLPDDGSSSHIVWDDVEARRRQRYEFDDMLA